MMISYFSYSRMSLFTGLMVAVLSLSFSSSVQADVKVIQPPSPSVEVKVGTYLIDLLKIDDVEQLFNADVIVRIEWQDKRLVNGSGMARTMPLDAVWNPQMIVANLRNVKTHLPDVVEVSPEGVVTYRQRMIGDFTARLDLREFPKDQQRLGIQVIAQGYTPEEVYFVHDKNFTGRSEELTISDWAIGDVVVLRDDYEIPRIGKLAGVNMEFDAKRHVNYYFATIFASAVIIGCMAWMVFWLPLEAINPRVSISVTSMLTLIAHRFVAGSKLPKLAYLTNMDYFLLSCTIMVLLGLIGVVTVFRASSKGRPESGARLNRIFRWLYPTIFLAIIIIMT
jgi:hypothetical protein